MDVSEGLSLNNSEHQSAGAGENNDKCTQCPERVVSDVLIP